MSQSDSLSVFVAADFVEPVRAELARAFRVTFATSEDPLAELAASGDPHEALIFSLDLPLRAETIESLPESVRALATYSVGTDHIDFAAAKARGLAVFHTPGVLADSVAENAIFLMLASARRATESIELIRSRAWPGWSPTQLVGAQLSGRTLGIFGMGDIGERIATRAQALGMQILYCNRNPRPSAEAIGAQFRDSLDALVADSDVLMLACPSTEETRGILGEETLRRARSGLIVVNIARGDVVDDEALIAALRGGRVWGAGLDVFAGEPNVHPDYFDLPNVFMVPHIGSSTLEARLGMGRSLIEGLSAWSRGDTPENRCA
ncbi:MAG: 2-hydroxyacid dehydrogenase [Myxococcota bacterium]